MRIKSKGSSAYRVGKARVSLDLSCPLNSGIISIHEEKKIYLTMNVSLTSATLARGLVIIERIMTRCPMMMNSFQLIKSVYLALG